MYQEFYSKMDEVRNELYEAISMVSVITDGVSSYSQHSSLTGARADAYSRALISVCDMLSDASKKLENLCGEAGPERQEAIA